MAHTKAITTRPSGADKKGTENSSSVPLSIYSGPGGLPQDPGRAAKSLAEAKTGMNWGLGKMRAEPKYDHAVVVAGAGPTGLMLGCELALAGVDVAIVERRPNQDLVGSRAGALHSRTIEVLD